MTYSLYFHIPFCVHRCAYCDFNTYAGKEALIPAYVDALCREINFVGSRFPSPVYGRRERGEGIHTLFFGGGTPSLLTPRQFEQILRTVRDSFGFSTSDTSGISGTSETLETSLEANPGTVTLDSLRDLRRLGFNRISFGVQSAHPDELRQLERIHNFYEVIHSVEWARRAGFDNLNLDLIYGLPEQTLERWQATVKRAVDLAPDHLSLYALTVEAGTPFGRWAARGLMPMPDPDLAADMYEWAEEYLESRGYEQYEISNWAKPGFQCRHNLQYWRNLPYLGMGAGAHGYFAGVRTVNTRGVRVYIQNMQKDWQPVFPAGPAVESTVRVERWMAMQEHMMVGLRLLDEGVSDGEFTRRFQVSLRSAFPKQIERMERVGLLEWGGNGADILRLTRRGWLLGNQVFSEFVDLPESEGLPGSRAG